MGCSTTGTSALYEIRSDLSSKNTEQLCKVREKSEHYYLFPEKVKDLLEEKAEAARERADSYSNWNERAEDRASELEDQFSDIEGLYDEIDSAYDELYRAERTLSTAVMGTYVLN